MFQRSSLRFYFWSVHVMCVSNAESDEELLVAVHYAVYKQGQCRR